jgi:hypothetical protein
VRRTYAYELDRKMSSQPSVKKSAGLTPVLGCSPRVGYVNVNGLDELKWKAYLKLLHTSLEFLFLAETWLSATVGILVIDASSPRAL